MAKNEKLKQMDICETKGVSGGTIYAAPSSAYGSEVTMYYVRTSKGLEKFVNEEQAKNFAESSGLSTTIVNVATESEANKLSTSLPNRF